MPFDVSNFRPNARTRREWFRAGIQSAALLSCSYAAALAQGTAGQDAPKQPAKPAKPAGPYPAGPVASPADAANPYVPFRMGIQSYSLRHFKTDEMLARVKDLGLHTLEAYPAHFPMTDDPKILDGYKEQLKASGIQLVAYGVLNFSGDEADARRKFAFGKAMGVEVLTASPKPEAFPILDKLVDEYKINIAIHNHGPGDMYDVEDKLRKAIEGHNPRIGSCNDTGHYLLSDVSPVLVAKDLGSRTYDVHLKNVKVGMMGKKEFTEVGATGGLLDTVALFRVLIEAGYKGPIMLEYEEHPDDPMPQIKACLEATQRYTKTCRDSGFAATAK